MDKIIKELTALKSLIALSNAPMKWVDDINCIIGMCEQKKQMVNAMTEPMPGQSELLPAAGIGEIFNPSFVIEHATINVYGNIPPGFDMEVSKNF